MPHDVNYLIRATQALRLELPSAVADDYVPQMLALLATLKNPAVSAVLDEHAHQRGRYDEFHDDAHGAHELSQAAAYYAYGCTIRWGTVPDWVHDEFQRHHHDGQTHRQALVRSAAFAISAIECLDRKKGGVTCPRCKHDVRVGEDGHPVTHDVDGLEPTGPDYWTGEGVGHTRCEDVLDFDLQAGGLGMSMQEVLARYPEAMAALADILKSGKGPV